MRRLLLIAALPLALAACNNSTPPAPTPPAKTPTAEAPAQPKPATEVALAPLFGNWAVSPETCTAPIVISAKRFEGDGKSCDITALTDNGDGSFSANLSCAGGGQSTASLIPVFGPQGEGVMISHPTSAKPVAVFRCTK